MSLNPPRPVKRGRGLSPGLIPTWTPGPSFLSSENHWAVGVQPFHLERGNHCWGAPAGSEVEGWPHWGPGALAGPSQPQQLADERTQAKQPSAE